MKELRRMEPKFSSSHSRVRSGVPPRRPIPTLKKHPFVFVQFITAHIHVPLNLLLFFLAVFHMQLRSKRADLRGGRVLTGRVPLPEQMDQEPFLALG